MRANIIALPAFMFSCLFAQPAQAHGGHLIELAGHDHWIAATALGAAALAALWELIDEAATEAGDQEEGAMEEGDAEECQA